MADERIRELLRAGEYDRAQEEATRCGSPLPTILAQDFRDHDPTSDLEYLAGLQSYYGVEGDMWGGMRRFHDKHVRALHAYRVSFGVVVRLQRDWHTRADEFPFHGTKITVDTNGFRIVDNRGHTRLWAMAFGAARTVCVVGNDDPLLGSNRNAWATLPSAFQLVYPGDTWWIGRSPYLPARWVPTSRRGSRARRSYPRSGGRARGS